MNSRILLCVICGVLWLSSGCDLQAEGSRSHTGMPQAERQPPPSPVRQSTATTRQPASALYFLDDTHGWVMLGGVLYSTRDGGKSWAKINQQELQSVVFVDQQNGWALRDRWATEQRANFVLSTRDGGRSWNEVLKLPTPVYTVDFLDAKTGYVSGRWYPLQRTVDGGKTWMELDGTEGLNYLFFLDEKRGWGYGGGIWYTADGGETWKQVVDYEEAGDLWDADFVDSSTGWIIGAGHQLWRTTDGRTWQQVTDLPDVKKELHSVDFIDRNEGWITTEDGQVLHTMDEGATWRIVAVLPQSAGSIKFLTSQEGWMVNGQGELLHTTDGGKTWNVQRLF